METALRELESAVGSRVHDFAEQWIARAIKSSEQKVEQAREQLRATKARLGRENDELRQAKALAESKLNQATQKLANSRKEVDALKLRLQRGA